jgi:hypothetical protein
MGLSTQKCVVMTPMHLLGHGIQKIMHMRKYFLRTMTKQKFPALANTVGVGLTNPENAIHVTVTATLASAKYAGVSPLTIDLNNPEVVDFWPKCLESCTNAEVGVRFNTSMSNRNLPGSIVSGPVKLLKCNDENCLSTVPAFGAADIVLDGASDYKVLKVANSSADSVELEPNTIYMVVLSASSTDSNATDLLWSAAKLRESKYCLKTISKTIYLEIQNQTR